MLVASRMTPPRLTPRVSSDAKLALVEFVLGSLDIEASADQALDWLATYAGVRQALCMAVDASGRHLLSVGERGVELAASWGFSIELADQDQPLVRMLNSRVPGHFSGGAVPAWSPLGPSPFHVIPLRAPQSDMHGPADGLLLVAGVARLSADVLWAADVLGRQLFRLRSRHSLSETRFGRERVLLYSIINAVSDPILLTDIEGKLIIANSRAEKLFYSPDDASEGRRQAVSFNNMLFSAALSSGAMEPDEPARRELLLVDPIEGSDLLFEHISSAVRDLREGTSVVSILRNVTDLGRATAEFEDSQRRLRVVETEVREERHRLELIIDSVADPILVTDPNGDIVLMNAPSEKIFAFHWGAADQVQRRVRANGAHFTSFISNLLFSGAQERWLGEINLTNPETGAPLPVEAVAGKILSEKGELTWVVTILHDRTEAMEKGRLYEELKHASEELEMKIHAATADIAQQNELLRRQALELEQASTLKSQFLANMSHEFRTPLNAILGYTHMLLQGVQGGIRPEQRTSLTRVDSNARHLLALINDILDITRIEAGRMPLHVTTFRLPDLVREVMSELEAIISRSKLQVVSDISPRTPLISSDRQKLKQIVLNLLSNALKFTPSGWVRITARHDAPSKTVVITVADTGVGIAPGDQEKVFEDFRQLDTSTTRPFSGTGLGLAICRRLAGMLGGRISLRSTVGDGSQFTLTLPLRLRRK
jgi:signal transduction histidine kinase